MISLPSQAQITRHDVNNTETNSVASTPRLTAKPYATETSIQVSQAGKIVSRPELTVLLEACQTCNGMSSHYGGYEADLRACRSDWQPCSLAISE